MKVISLQTKYTNSVLDFRIILFHFRKHSVLYGKIITLQIIFWRRYQTQKALSYKHPKESVAAAAAPAYN